MIVKGLIKETNFENGCSLKFYENDNLNIKWQIEGKEWILLNNDQLVPDDYKVIYICEKCGKKSTDYLYTIKKHHYVSICKLCRKNEYVSDKNFNGWTDVDGHKVQGPFEEMVAQWLVDHNIKFQTHASIEKKIYYTSVSGKKRKFSADFYLLDYDLILEPHSIYKDFQFEKKIEELKKQGKVLVLSWSDWRDQLSKIL